MKYKIIELDNHLEYLEQASKWFGEKWNVSENAYKQSMKEASIKDVPSWLIVLDEDKIIAGLGVIENDFHPRKDLSPNVCALYVEEAYRKQGIAGEMLNYIVNKMKKKNINTLYLITNHENFYERYGWKYIDDVICDEEDYSSRIYMHK